MTDEYELFFSRQKLIYMLMNIWKIKNTASNYKRKMCQQVYAILAYMKSFFLTIQYIYNYIYIKKQQHMYI